MSIPAKKTLSYYQKYTPDAVQDYDVIVIGSGMGGMACATALAKYGKRVLVLEQHYIPGGFTHMFSRKGYTWDVGVHAIGEVTEKDPPGRMLNWLTNDQVKMKSLGDPYDRFFYPGGFKIGFPDSKEKFVKDLIKAFPEEEKAVEAYAHLIEKTTKQGTPFYAFKSFPVWAERFGQKLLNLFFKDWWALTTEEVVGALTTNEKLKAVLVAQWGYYGSIPKESCWGLHAFMVRSFWNGAYYPTGGSTAFADAMLGTVKEKGGQTFVRASVDQIIVKNNKAVGVRLSDGHEIKAPLIISAAGAKNTINHLLPQDWQKTSWAESIRNIGNSASYICLNLGFKGNIRKAGADSCNFWFNQTWDMNHPYWNLKDPQSKAPILYVSYPSLKDEYHNPGPEMRHTGECVTFVDYDSFEQWNHTRRGKRTKEYQEFKRSVEDRLLAQLQDHIPEVMKYLDYYELSTPLTAEFFCKAEQGAIYGLESTPARYKCEELRTRTPIKNFLMTGVDVCTLGIAGAMVSGLLTAATVDKRIYKHLL